MCQNNIDNVLYYGGFEENFGCTFCCSECIGKQIKHIPPYCHDIFDSETSECEEEDQYNAIVENETDKIIIDDNIIELDIDDSEWSDEDDKYTSDSEVDNEEDEPVEDKGKCGSDVDNEEDDLEKDNDTCDSEVHDDELVVNDLILQNQITDHYLDNWNKVDTTFFSNKFKYLTKTRKKSHYLNVGKLIRIFGIHDEGFIDFNKWKQDNITVSNII